MSSNTVLSSSNKTLKNRNKSNTKTRKNVYASATKMIDNDGWITMLKPGKPTNDITHVEKSTSNSIEDEEIRQLSEAINQSIQSHKEYKLSEDVSLEYYINVSLHDEMEQKCGMGQNDENSQNDEEKQIKEAIELSLRPKNEYKSPEDLMIDIAKKMSMEYDVKLYSDSEFPSLSMSMSMSNKRQVAFTDYL